MNKGIGIVPVRNTGLANARKNRRLSRGLPRGEHVVVNQIKHHRNGVGGRPFHRVDFTYLDGDGGVWELSAIVPENPRRGECFVVSPSDPELCWRGDNFMECMVAAIEEKG